MTTNMTTQTTPPTPPPNNNQLTPPGATSPAYTLKVYAYDCVISYSAPYLINGREFRISFREGAEWPIYRPAEFRTTDPLIQQAIEAHPSFGPNIRILQTLAPVPHLINPLPPDFPRTPPPPPSSPPPAPRSKPPVTGARNNPPVTGAMPRRIRRALTRSRTHTPPPPPPPQ
jgi:hypothetical protein